MSFRNRLRDRLAMVAFIISCAVVVLIVIPARWVCAMLFGGEERRR